MKKNIQCYLLCFGMALFLTACGQGEGGAPEGAEPQDMQGAEVSVPADAEQEDALSGEQPADDITAAESNADDAEMAEEDEEEPAPFFMPGYETFDDWRARHLGSVGLVTDKTVLVSIYLNEPGRKWDEEDIDYTRKMMEIGYGFLKDRLADYGAKMELIFDSKKNSDLFYEIDIEEEIPVYVTTEKERELDVEVDKWIGQLPVQELMQKYEVDSIGFLFFIDHEGCSYSSMHFIDDGIETWDECCMVYLRDMYSKTLDYETPAVYAHELLHLFGAEDLYKDANVFSAETYAYAKKTYPEDVMINTFQKINGEFVVHADKVVKEISPITAYLVGVAGDEEIRENCPELLKEETGCFSGSTYDRDF